MASFTELVIPRRATPPSFDSESELLTLRMSGIWPAYLGRGRLDEAERRRVGVQPGVEGQLEVVARS